MSDDLVGRDKIQGSSSNTDPAAAAMKARAEEAAREAAVEQAAAAAAVEAIRSGRGGNISIGNSGVTLSGSNTSVGGSVAGRDLEGGNVTITNTSGMTAEDFTRAFSAIYDKIGKLPGDSQPVAKSAVDTIKAAAEKEVLEGKKPDAAAVEMTAQALAFTAPDLLQDVADVALATLQSPANGVVTIIRKVLDRVKAMRGGASA